MGEPTGPFLGRSFWEPLRRIGLGSSFGEQVCMFGKKLSTSCRRDTLLSALHKKNRFWEELWKAWRLCFAAAVTDSCGKLSGAAFTIFGVSFHNKNFKEQFSLATFGLSGASLKARLVLKGCSFGAISLDSRHLVATLRRSFREPLCRMALGSHFWCRLAALGPFGKQFWQLFVEKHSGTPLGSNS